MRESDRVEEREPRSLLAVSSMFFFFLHAPGHGCPGECPTHDHDRPLGVVVDELEVWTTTRIRHGQEGGEEWGGEEEGSAE